MYCAIGMSMSSLCGESTDSLTYIVLIMYFSTATASTTSNLCTSTRDRFQCDNGRCVHDSLVCDEMDDCGDNSDEEQGCGM